MTSWADRERGADATWRNDRVTAERVPCAETGCGAGVGETCRYLHDDQHRPLVKQAAHARRIEAGKAKAAEETQG